MKAKELMIGDLVYAIFDIEDENEDYITEEVPVKIIGIDENCSLGDGYPVSYIPIGDVPDECCDCFDPIPLTAEILEKNGFYKMFFHNNDIWAYSLNISHNTDLIVSCAFSLIKISIGNPGKQEETVIAKIEYIHELQHALRLLGLTEFSGNLKL